MYGIGPYQVLLVKIKRLTLSAIFTAIGVVILYIGCFFQVADLSVCAIASLIVVMAALELGLKSAFAIYLATSVISLLILPAKFIAATYAVFVGCYPLLKNLFERLPKAVSWILKLLSANAALTLMFVLSAYVFKIDDKMTAPIIAATYALANIAIVLFDIALNRLILLYHYKFRKMLGIAKMMRPK
jgi:hypothetical protein